MWSVPCLKSQHSQRPAGLQQFYCTNELYRAGSCIAQHPHISQQHYVWSPSSSSGDQYWVADITESCLTCLSERLLFQLLLYCSMSLIQALCRIRFDYSECLVGPSNTQVLEHAIAELAKRYQMDWRMFYDSKVKRVAILVSKLDHCLYDLLIRLKAGELNCQVPVIISNHPDLAPIAKQFGVAFRYLSPFATTAAAASLISDCQHHLSRPRAARTT